MSLILILKKWSKDIALAFLALCCMSCGGSLSLNLPDISQFADSATDRELLGGLFPPQSFEPIHQELGEARSALYRGDIDRAYRILLSNNGLDQDYFKLLGLTLLALERPSEASHQLSKSLALNDLNRIVAERQLLLGMRQLER